MLRRYELEAAEAERLGTCLADPRIDLPLKRMSALRLMKEPLDDPKRDVATLPGIYQLFPRAIQIGHISVYNLLRAKREAAEAHARWVEAHARWVEACRACVEFEQELERGISAGRILLILLILAPDSVCDNWFQLSHRQQQVYLLSQFGRSQHEIGELLGIDHRSCGTHLQRAHDRLRIAS